MGFYLQMSFPIRLCSVNVSILFNIKRNQEIIDISVVYMAYGIQ